jgi:hypothetical protein
MTFKSQSHSWLCVWLSCLLATLLPTAPLMACWVQEEARSEANDPVESDPSEVVDDVTLSHSRSEFRRTQRLNSSSASLRQFVPRSLCRPVIRATHGQRTLWGRSPPLHC